MSYKQFIYWWQKSLPLILVRVAVRAVVIICLTVGVLGILGSTASISNAQLVSTIKGIQDKQTPLKSTALNATVYHSPDCNCCGGWIDHLKAQGFKITDFSTPDIETVKQKYNVPDNLSSCHTAIVNGYVIEGHVPGDDIKRLLQEKPNVAGLSVPQMPVGTPGMEIGDRKDPFMCLPLIARIQLRYSINIHPLDVISLYSEDVLKVDFHVF